MKPNYYAIIPAEVRYNEKLSPNAKLLYGEITALTSKKGVCWAQNIYFAELYNVDTKTVSRWIHQLQEEGLIDVKMQYKKGTKYIEQREIRIGIKHRDKNVPIYGQKNPKHRDKNVQDNIYSNNINNNTSNNNKSVKPKKPTKDTRSFSDFPPDVQKSFIPICELFEEHLRPKTADEKRNWCNAIDEVNRLEKVSPRKLYLLIKKVLQNDFWIKNFMTMNKIRKKNKDGIKYIDVFMHQFGKDFKNLDI